MVMEIFLLFVMFVSPLDCLTDAKYGETQILTYSDYTHPAITTMDAHAPAVTIFNPLKHQLRTGCFMIFDWRYRFLGSSIERHMHDFLLKIYRHEVR